MLGRNIYNKPIWLKTKDIYSNRVVTGLFCALMFPIAFYLFDTKEKVRGLGGREDKMVQFKEVWFLLLNKLLQRALYTTTMLSCHN